MQYLQPFLGLDKSNPFFEVLTDPSYPDEALVHFGTRLLEKVRLGKDSVEAKLLAGRLYNAGFSRKALVEKFGWDRKTIQGYANALKSGCAETLRQALSGQGAMLKLDAQALHFIRQTFREVCAEKGCHSNAHIRKELKTKCGINVSREAIRPIINAEILKMQQTQETSCIASPTEGALTAPNGAVPGEDPCRTTDDSASNTPKNGNISPSSTPKKSSVPARQGLPETLLLHHGGLSLVRPWIDNVTQDIGPSRDLCRQWLCAILCNCVNIEQMGRLNYSSLAILIGPQINSINTQRQKLLRIATPQLTATLRQHNLNFLNLKDYALFYYDPHGIEYTGQLAILKGWLGGSHRIGKAYYQDFIHTLDGKPMAAFLDDNRSNLLKRLPPNIQELRRLLGRDAESPITLVVDRAVYSLPDLIDYRDKLNIHIVTWEKNCTRPPWQPPSPDAVKRLYIPKPRNNSQDVITYKIEYYVQPWTRDSSVNQYIIRMSKGPGAEPITLSILCTHPTLAPNDAIYAILTRWVQENNIGYLINHNGINEITSYQHYTYEQAAKRLQLDSELTSNPALRKLAAQKGRLRRDRISLHLDIEDRTAQYQLQQQSKTEGLDQIQKRLSTADPTAAKKLKKQRASLRSSLKTLPTRRQDFLDKTQKKVADIELQIDQVTRQYQLEPKEVQRLDYLIDQEYDRLNFAPKACMDAIRLLAHNIHRRLHDQFRPLYGNYRNDHRILRELIQSPALLEETADEYLVRLIPSRLHGKDRNLIIELINQLPQTQTASGKSLRLELSEPLQGVHLAI